MSKFGDGKKFRHLSNKLKKSGARNPDALAAAIGRKKYGAKRFAQLAAAGRALSAKAKRSTMRLKL